MPARNRVYNTVDVVQLQQRIQNAISDADFRGLVQCSVSTTNRYAVEDAIAPFRNLGYEIHLFQREGTLGRNLIRLPMTEIVLKLNHLGAGK